MTKPPILFDPAMETVADDENATAMQLVETMRGIMETTAADYGQAVRGVHAKSHGLLRGELRVLPDLPRELAQGAFARANSYPVVLRFSTNPGDILDDSVSVPRGLAIKLIGVEGDRLPGPTADANTQDFVMAAAPAFAAPDSKAFLGSLKLLARTTDTPQGLKKALSSVLRGAEKVVEAFGGESAAIKQFGGYPQTHILGETFWTQVPFRYGDYVAKLSVAPLSPETVALAGTTIDAANRPDALREEVADFFATRGAEWEVRVQLLTNRDTMPIEDASVPWPEDESPYRAVATISVPAQDSWSDAKRAAFDEALAFSPWHGLAAHRPLGSIMRARRPTYEMSASFRSARNGCPIHEPRDASSLPA